MNDFALSSGNIGQDRHELGSGEIAYLAAPQSLHPSHVEVFKEQLIVLVRQFMGKLEEPITATVDHCLIDAGNIGFRLAPVVGELDLAGDLALCGLQFSHCSAIVQRAFNVFIVRRLEEDFQAKVESCAVTCQNSGTLVDFLLNDEVQPEIAKTITLDGDSLDVCWDIARLAELIDNAANLNLVIVEQLPAALFHRKAAIPLDLLKAWGRGLHLALEIAKEQLVGFIDALRNVLNRLAINQVPMAVLGQFLKFGDMSHQGVHVQALASQAIIPAMQSDTVVIDQPTDVDLLVQVLILFRAIEFEFVCLDDLHKVT